jgi:hypothetical protein
MRRITFEISGAVELEVLLLLRPAAFSAFASPRPSG